MGRSDVLNNLILEHSRSNIGYDQGQRWTWLDKANKKIVPNGEGDCSAVTIGLIWLAGYAVPSANIAGSGTCYTGNAYELLATKAGFKPVNVRGWTVAQINNSSQPGDALLKDGHIMIKAPVSGNKWYSMNMDEHGNISGGAAGDQTGNESSIRDLWMPSIGWQYIFQVPDRGSTTTLPTDPGTDTIDTPKQVVTPTPAPGYTSGTTLVENPVTNVRKGPSTTYAVVSTLGPNITVTGTLVDGWIKVSTPTNIAGNYVSTTVLGTVKTTPTATQKPTIPTLPTDPGTVVVPPTEKDPDPTPTTPPAQTQTLLGLNELMVTRLQVRLNERLALGLPLTGTLDKATISAWQQLMGSPVTGELGAPSVFVQTFQKQLNSERAKLIASGKTVQGRWQTVKENGVWGYSTASAASCYILYWDGLARP